MTEMKSLADKLRESVATPIDRQKKPLEKKIGLKKAGYVASTKMVTAVPDILKQILEYDTSLHKTMVHARFDAKTAKMLGHFKMATGVENTRIAAFAVKYLFDCHPELKTLIKNYIENLEI